MDDPLIVPISVERVFMCLVPSAHRDARPAKLLDRDQRLLQMGVLGEDMRP